MNVLVLGGTGAIGKHLVDCLAVGTNKIYVTTRRQRTETEHVSYVVGNAHDYNFICSILDERHWDAVVDFMSYNTEEFKLRVKHFLETTDQYIYISSARVYANSSDPITEDSPRLLDVCKDADYLKTDEYALTKARQENLLRESGRTNWTIIRPYITFSEIRLQLSPLEKECWLYRVLQGRTIVFSRDLADRLTTLTYGADVARCIAVLVGKDEALGEAFHITIGESHKWSELLQLYVETIEKVTGKRLKTKIVNEWEPYHGGHALQVKWDRCYDRKFDSSKIAKFIDTSTFKPTKVALQECLTHFIQHPSFLGIDWIQEAKKDKLTHEWASLHEIAGIKTKIKYLLYRIGILK